ncbi:hypothetical protein LCGC14_1520430 [marine sediment metagenome]|uniref:Uncharacterized protein n=1 Tax=marine sediment metagenome TaxID=412755 RepID=A0A0F9JJP1_9ZZZZ
MAWVFQETLEELLIGNQKKERENKMAIEPSE